MSKYCPGDKSCWDMSFGFQLFPREEKRIWRVCHTQGVYFDMPWHRCFSQSVFPGIGGGGCRVYAGWAAPLLETHGAQEHNTGLEKVTQTPNYLIMGTFHRIYLITAKLWNSFWDMLTWATPKWGITSISGHQSNHFRSSPTGQVTECTY